MGLQAMESLFTLDLPAALAWQNLGLCLLGMAAGTLIGTFLGTLPTFVAASVMLVGLPLSGSTAAAILAGGFCGALYGTSLSVVLAGAPARPPDGPAAEKPAQARPGAGALLVASLLGSTVATLVALLLGCAVLLVFVAVPGNLMTAIALAMGNPEFVALIAVFLVLVVALGGGTPPKALVMMMLGLALAYVSADGEHGEPSESQDRYITLLALGLVTFAAALVRLRAVNVTPPAPLRPWLPRRKDLMQIVRPALRGGGVGLLLGLLPMEILVLRFVAYRIEQGLAKDRARNPSARRGMIELGAGVLPIGPIMAITAAVMVLPGPLPFIEEPALFWSTVAAMWTGNMIVLALGLGLAGACVRLLLVPRHIILGAVILAGCASIYMAYSSFADVGAAIIL